MSNAPLAFVLPVAVLLLILAGFGGLTAARGWTGSLVRAGRLGVHSPAAASSDDAFAVANKVAAPVVAGASLIAIVMALLVVVLPVPTSTTVVIGVIAVIAVLVLTIAAGVLGEKAARTLPVPARKPGSSPACAGCACGSGGCSGLTRNAVPLDAGTV